MAVSTGPDAETIRAVVSRYFDSITRMDGDAFVGCFAEDVEHHDPEGAPPHQGHDGVRGFFEGMAQLCESCVITPGDVYIGGSRAAVAWTLTARGKNGREASGAGVDIFTVDGDGLIRELHGFWDPGPFVTTPMS